MKPDVISPDIKLILPNTLWPVSAEYLSGLSDSIRPSPEELNNLTFPWELLDLLLNKLTNLTEQKIDKTVEIREGVKINGAVTIESGVRVLENTVLNGPLYVGKNTLIGNSAVVRGAFVGENSEIGMGVDIGRSVIGNQSRCTTSLKDSLVGNKVWIGAGATVSNIRFDEQNIEVIVNGKKVSTGRKKLGVIIGNNSSIGSRAYSFPGILIGENCTVYPGVEINANLSDSTIIRAIQTTQVITRK